MNYAKPEVVIRGSALAEVQGQGLSKGLYASDVIITPHNQPNVSTNAYEADE